MHTVRSVRSAAVALDLRLGGDDGEVTAKLGPRRKIRLAGIRDAPTAVICVTHRSAAGLVAPVERSLCPVHARPVEVRPWPNEQGDHVARAGLRGGQGGAHERQTVAHCRRLHVFARVALPLLPGAHARLPEVVRHDIRAIIVAVVVRLLRFEAAAIIVLHIKGRWRVRANDGSLCAVR